MAESTLSNTKTDFEAKLGDWAGYGRGPNGTPSSTWSTGTNAAILDSVKSGLSRVYHCGHDWTFLQLVGSLVIEDGAQEAYLPDDFCWLKNPISIQASTGGLGYKIPICGVGEILRMYSDNPSATGKPQFAAVTVGTRPNSGGSARWKMMVFPEADEATTLRFPYSVLPDYLDGSHPYVYGGAQHTELFLVSCMAVWEERFDNSSFVQKQAFKEQLEMSIRLDKRNQPRNFGHNGDDSDNAGWETTYRPGGLVMYEGTQY